MVKTLTHRQFRALFWYAAGKQGTDPTSKYLDKALIDRGYIRKVYINHYQVTEKGRDALHRDPLWRALIHDIQGKVD